MQHRYRRSSRYARSSGSRPLDYVMPFLIIICLGIVLVLLFHLWKAIFTEEKNQAAYIHIVDGSVEMKAWGTEDFFSLNTDTLVMQGDELKTSADAKAIIEFFDGTIARLDGNTSVVVSEVDSDEDDPMINLELNAGAIWFNRAYKESSSTEIVVRADHLDVKSGLASIFEVENSLEQVVRVFSVFEKGDGVMTDVLADDLDTVVETEKVGVGQEMVVNEQILQAYLNYQSPTVIKGISDEFKQTAWYMWNIAEDKSPTQFEVNVGVDNVGLVKVEPEVVDTELDQDSEPEEEDEVIDEEETPVEDEDSAETEEETPAPSADLAAPTVTAVAGGTEKDANGFYRVTSNVAAITGSVSGASKVVVNGYTLQKFSPGDTTWTYYANADYGLMAEGENSYKVYSEDANGNQSEPIVVKVFYDPVEPEPEVNDDQEPVEEGDESELTGEEGT